MRQEDSPTQAPFCPAGSTGRRLKLFLWGDSGAGKTTLALQFPAPVVVDMEGGCDLYGDRFRFDRLRTTDADAAMEAIDWLRDHDHGYETVIVDPITVYWEALQHKWSEIFLARNRQSRGFKFEYYEFQMKDWLTIKAEWKEFIRKLIAIDMNVVVVARQKTLFAEAGLRPVGDTFDAEKSIPYLFDTIVRLYRDEKKRFLAECQKDRSGTLPTAPFEVNYSVFEKCLHARNSAGDATGELPSGNAGGAPQRTTKTETQEV